MPGSACPLKTIFTIISLVSVMYCSSAVYFNAQFRAHLYTRPAIISLFAGKFRGNVRETAFEDCKQFTVQRTSEHRQLSERRHNTAAEIFRR